MQAGFTDGGSGVPRRYWQNRVHGLYMQSSCMHMTTGRGQMAALAQDEAEWETSGACYRFLSVFSPFHRHGSLYCPVPGCYHTPLWTCFDRSCALWLTKISSDPIIVIFCRVGWHYSVATATGTSHGRQLLVWTSMLAGRIHDGKQFTSVLGTVSSAKPQRLLGYSCYPQRLLGCSCYPHIGRAVH